MATNPNIAIPIITDTAGAGDSTSIVATDADGLIDPTFLTERVQDIVGDNLVTDTTSVVWTYTDAAGTLEANVQDEYVEDVVAALIQDGTGLNWTYVDGSDTLTGNVTLAPFTTDDLAEGVTNLYYTDERAEDAVGALVTNTPEIGWTYTDATPSLEASLVAGSIDETKLDASVNASLDLADSAVQPGDNLTDLVAPGSDTEVLLNDGGVAGSNSDFSYVEAAAVRTLKFAGDEAYLKKTVSGPTLSAYMYAWQTAGTFAAVTLNSLASTSSFSLTANTASLAGDSAGALSWNGNTFNTAAYKAIGTSGDALGLLNTANTHAETQAFTKGITLGASASSGNAYSGTWSPTLATSTNVDSHSVLKAYYIRMGNVVHATIRMNVDATTSGVLTELEFDLPIATNINTGQELHGSGSASTSTAILPIFVAGNSSAEQVLMRYFPNSGGNTAMGISFTYYLN